MQMYNALLRQSQFRVNDIGRMGFAGAGVGICPPERVPDGLTLLSHDPHSAHFGNYQYLDGSVMCYRPAVYYRIGHPDSPLYARFGLNSIDIKSVHDFESSAIAAAAGYALHRDYINAGVEQPGIFEDKFFCSANSYGGNVIASSLKNGDPLTPHADHNPIAQLTACTVNQMYEAFNAAIGRGSIFFPLSRFSVSATAMLSMAHGQAATSTAACAWYDPGGQTNYPKGCNNNARGDVDDPGISYVSDGYSTCGKTGSGTPFARTTHNGQACGIADVNGLLWVISSGLVRDSGNNGFYVLKTAANLNALTGGLGGATDAWGTAAQIEDRYDVIDLPYIANLNAWGQPWGNGDNQILDPALSGAGWILTGLAMPKNADARSVEGTSLFGTDGIYERHIASLCLTSGGIWYSASAAGVWAANFSSHRTHSHNVRGVRCACYPKPL